MNRDVVLNGYPLRTGPQNNQGFVNPDVPIQPRMEHIGALLLLVFQEIPLRSSICIKKYLKHAHEKDTPKNDTPTSTQLFLSMSGNQKGSCWGAAGRAFLMLGFLATGFPLLICQCHRFSQQNLRTHPNVGGCLDSTVGSTSPRPQSQAPGMGDLRLSGDRMGSETRGRGGNRVCRFLGTPTLGFKGEPKGHSPFLSSES